MSARAITIEDSEREVVVRLGAPTSSPAAPAPSCLAHFPVRRYLPADDVEPGVLSRTEKSTHCPFKGDATYWTLAVNGARVERGLELRGPDPAGGRHRRARLLRPRPGEDHRRVMHGPVGEILVQPDELRAASSSSATRSSRDYEGRDLLLVGVLKGAVFFLSI